VHNTITQLGPREAEFLSLVAAKGTHFVSERAVEFWGTREMANKKLHQLERRGWIARLERGKYIVIPLEAGSGRNWSEDPYLVASIIVQPAVIAYWSAIRHWNWTEQIPRVIYVQTTTRKKLPQRTVFGVQYQFVTVAKKKIYGHSKEWRKGTPVLITDREKTLLDCADDVGRAGGIEELCKAVKAAAGQISWPRLDEYANRFPNRSVMKRLGFLFETLVTGLPSEALKVLEAWHIRLSAGVVPLQPGGRKSGRIVTRWRLLVNAEVG